MLIEVATVAQGLKLLKLEKLGEIEMKVEIHRTLNLSLGVITDRELEHTTEEELLGNLNDQDVCVFRRIKRHVDGRLANTNSFTVTFATPTLPKSIKIAYVRCNVRPYVTDSQRYIRCQWFGHTKLSCSGRLTCVWCGKEGHENKNCTAEPCCVNCHDKHASYIRKCSKMLRKSEMLRKRSADS